MSVALARSLIEKWPLTRAMAERELRGSNKGTVLGIGWLVVRPFIQVAVYVLIISYVFRVRLAPEAGLFDYALYVLAGLFVWQLLQRCIEGATSLIRERAEILKQVVYPIETLPITGFIVGALGPLVVLAVYLVLALFSGELSWTAVLLPIPMLLLFAMILGASWVLMVIGVIVPDIREVLSILLSVLIYLSPVLLSESMVPHQVWLLVLLNPLSHPVIAFRDVLQGEFHPASWAVFAGVALGSLTMGAVVVTRAKVTINEYI